MVIGCLEIEALSSRIDFEPACDALTPAGAGSWLRIHTARLLPMSRPVEPTGTIVGQRSMIPGLNSVAWPSWDEIKGFPSNCMKASYPSIGRPLSKLDVLSRSSHRTTPHEAVSQLRSNGIIYVISTSSSSRFPRQHGVQCNGRGAKLPQDPYGGMFDHWR